ncbi:MAG: amino acid ABC transporter substrate-binding protein [Acidimicrobiia bacterium]
MKLTKLLVALAALMLIVAACTSDDGGDATTTAAAGSDTTAAPSGGDGGSSDGETMAAVQARGELNCGTRDALTGFAVLTEDGEHVGFDSDFCRVIAAAILGDATAVNHVDLETADRFTALQSGQVDVLVRNTTWTASRDGGESATFLTVTYYDGQGMMVPADAGYASIEDMDGVIVCVAKGTTTEGNAAAEAARLGLDWEVRPFDSNDLIQEAFNAGQCDGWSADSSALTGIKADQPDGPDSVVILPEVFSKEPLAPLVLDGDTQWAQAVNWAILATIQAEEWGITSDNVDTFLTSDDANVVKFLGGEFEDGDGNVTILDPGLGLPADFAYQVIKQVGNYGEIFAVNLEPLGLERGINALWFDGGLLYAPPYR